MSVLLAVPTDGLSFAGAFGLAKTLQGFAGTAANVTKTIGGKTVSAVVSSMVDAIGALTVGIDQQEQDIAGYLDRIGGQLEPADIAVPPPSAVTDVVHNGPAALPARFYPDS